MPTYTPPVFNVVAQVWAPPALPSTGVPTFAAYNLQVYTFSRVPPVLFHPGSGRWLPLIILREAFANAVHLGINYIVSHSFPPLTSQPFYKVQYAQLMHVGFSNQYFAYYCLQCNSNGTIPRTPLPT